MKTSLSSARQWRLKLLTLCLMASAGSSTAHAGRVVVRMPERAEVSTRDVYLRDVARISGEDDADVRLAGGVDLTTLEGRRPEPVQVTAEYVRIRLILRGLAHNEVEVLGCDTTEIMYREHRPLNDADVERAALEVLTDAMNVQAEDLKVSLTNPFMLLVPADVRELPGLRVEILRPSDTSPGQKNLTIRLWNADNLLMTRSARFNVLKRYRLAVTRVSLTRDQPIDDSQVQLESRFLDRDADEVSPEALQGRVVQKSIGAGEVIALRDLAVPKSNASSAVMIKRRDSVPVIARIGGIEIRMRSAEALQDGRVGDSIQMKNLETQRTFVGKVHPLGHVEVH